MMTKEEAVELLQTCTYFGRSAWEFEEAKEMAIKALTADVKPVVRGEWEYWAGGLLRCPVCGYEYNDYLECDNFCGNCGAEMRSRENLEAGAEYADADTMMPAT